MIALAVMPEEIRQLALGLLWAAMILVGVGSRTWDLLR